MEAHDFNALLRSVAEEVQEPVKENLFDNKEPDLFGSHISSRWYLKETADEVDQAEQSEGGRRRRPPRKVHGQLTSASTRKTRASTTAISSSSTSPSPTSRGGSWPTGCPNTSSRHPRHLASSRQRARSASRQATLRQTGTLRRIKRFANALIDGVPVRDKDRPGSDVDLLDWLRQCRRAGLYEQGRAIYEKGGLNLANLTDEQQIEAEDDYRICARRGSEEEAKPKKRQRKMLQDDDED